MALFVFKILMMECAVIVVTTVVRMDVLRLNGDFNNFYIHHAAMMKYARAGNAYTTADIHALGVRL